MRNQRGLDEDVRGVVVVEVEIVSPLADANIVPSAIIYSINDHPTRNAADWDDVVRPLRSGDAVKVEVLDPGSSTTRFVFLRVPRDH